MMCARFEVSFPKEDGFVCILLISLNKKRESLKGKKEKKKIRRRV